MLDLDRNTATGDDYGSDYALEVGQDGSGLFAGVWKYIRGDWVEISPTPAMMFSADANDYTFTFATNELGGASGFDYYVASGAWSESDLLAADFAPDEGSWTYWPLTTASWGGGGALAGLPDGSLYLGGDDGAWHRIDPATLEALGLDQTPITYYGVLPGALGDPVTPIVVATPTPMPTPVTQAAAPAMKPVIAKPVTYPAKPVAGKTFRLTFAVTRSDTLHKLLDGKMICDPSVKGKVITHFERFKDGTASMRFTIPKAYKGEYMKVHLTINAGGESTTRDVMFHVT